MRHYVSLGVVLAALLAAPAYAQQTARAYLSGTGNEDSVIWDFYCTAGRNSGKWTTIPVPSNWEYQGFGNFTYFRDDRKKPVESGKYRHEFKVPADWEGKRIFMVFDGSMTDTTVSVNGQSAGPKHQGAFYRFRYDVTKLLKVGEANRLEVTVDKLSSDESVNRAEREGDYWVHGGIFRPVYLEAVPREHIDHIAIDARADGSIAVDVYPAGVESADNIVATVIGPNVRQPFSIPVKKGQDRVRMQMKIANVRTWTSETPNLYTLEVLLRKGEQAIHTIQKRFGFRTVEIRPADGIYINGMRVMLKGCCRHSFWPDSGRTLSRKISELDVGLMKEMNMNAVRMSHYPPDEHFLDVCDEEGLYVLDELAGWQKAYGTDVGKKLVREMVERDVNHPSIIMWDNGNEGGWNTALDGEFAKYDPQNRQVIHPWGIMGPTNTKHYPDWAALNKLLNEDKVFFPTEFLHGLYDGGAGAGLADYWEAMRKSKVCAGGFIWAFLDEGAKRGDLGGKIDVAGNQAPDGIVGPYREKEGSFYTIKQVWSPVVIDRPAYAVSPELLFFVENRFDFTDLEQCTFFWQAIRFQETTGTTSVVAEGKLSLDKLMGGPARISPGLSGRLRLPLSDLPHPTHVLAFRAVDPYGREVCRRSWPMAASETLVVSLPASESRRGEVQAAEDDDSISLLSRGTVARFSKKTGQLVSLRTGGRELPLKNGPRIVVGQSKLEKIEHHQQGYEHMIAATYSGELKSVTWCTRGDWLQLDYEYTASGPQPYLGITFDWPESKMKKVKWLGLGPYRVWKNRMQGPQFGLWENDYNDTLAGYQTWKFPEFRGYFGDVRWMKLTSDEGSITVIKGPENTFVRPDIMFVRLGTDPKITDKRASYMNAEPMYPPGDISFLHAIPPIGNKFTPASKIGPSSQLTEAKGTYRGTLYFRFEK